MKLIIDAGSSKVAYALIKSKSDIMQTEGPGYNPTLDHRIIQIPPKIDAFLEKVSAIHYFGSGINHLTSIKKIKHVFTDRINKNVSIKIENDLLGCAIAAFHKRKGTIAILGTGSNLGYYSKERIIANKIPSLGYILGDEGSGFDIGRQLVMDYYKKNMPANLRMKFKKEYHLEKEILLKRIYKQNEPNKYLSNFTQFLSRIDGIYKDELLLQKFSNFLDLYYRKSENEKENKIAFVGSIAFYFKEHLQKVCQQRNIQIHSIIKEPLKGLIAYYNNDETEN